MCKCMWHQDMPTHHSTGTFTGCVRVPNCRRWSLYGKWRRGGACKVAVLTWIRETGAERKNSELIIMVKGLRPDMLPHPYCVSPFYNTGLYVLLNTLCGRELGQNSSTVIWKTHCQLSQTLDCSCCCQGGHNQLLGLGFDYFFSLVI